VLRADLFALLFRGRLRITFGDHTRELPDVFVFLFAEQLAALALGVLEAWNHRRSFHRRITAGGVICGVRLDGEGATQLTLGTTRKGPADRAETWTLPAVEVGALVRGVVAFGRALSRSLVRHDRRQGSNLRLLDLRSKIRDLSDRLRDATQDDSRINAAPERYRAFAQALGPTEPPPDSFGHARLRFDARWFATVPGIDLRATFLCGDALLVGSSREMCCLDRRTGELVWSRPVRRGFAVLTPAGLARMEPDGNLTLHDTATGRVLWTARLSPRVGASASGAVISGPGLPRMLVASDGSRHLAAIDLDTAEVRWRYATRRGGVFRVRRAGKLLIVGNGESALSALDVLTGEVVWRFRDPLGFSSHAAVDHDALFALAADGSSAGRGTARLHHFDPWSGALRWSVTVPAGAVSTGAPLLAPETVVVATHGRRGTCLAGFDRKTGALRFDLAASVAAAATVVVDDTVILNSTSGELIAIDANDGQTRYRHVFAGGHEGDRPRRLDPVLRSGALFVPQHELHMVRPRDGTLLGRVPADLVPDLFRVDERCNVYVMEESGHLAAFTAAPRLMLVK
jgi:outer membrane protein assembly factor BamB